jgi:hypothetical protein
VPSEHSRCSFRSRVWRLAREQYWDTSEIVRGTLPRGRRCTHLARLSRARRRSGSRERGRAVRPGRRKFTKTTGAGALRVLLSLFPETPQKNTLFKRTGKKKSWRLLAAETQVRMEEESCPGRPCSPLAHLPRARLAKTEPELLLLGWKWERQTVRLVVSRFWTGAIIRQLSARPRLLGIPPKTSCETKYSCFFFPPRKKQSPPNTTQIYISPKHSVQTPS